MSFRLKNFFKPFTDGGVHERMRVLLLSVCFFIVIGGYTIVKELKDLVFLNVVGLEYLPWVKFISILVLIPLVFFYAKLVDILRRYQLLVFYAIVFGVGGLIFSFLLGHKTIGLCNTDTSPYRIFGWIFYLFIEGYSPFIVSVLWAFANSVTPPDAVKSNYVTMTASAKLGGMVLAAFAWFLVSFQSSGAVPISEVGVYQFLMAGASLMLLCVPLVIIYLMKKVPGYAMHGYEAAYRVEKERAKEEKKRPKGFVESIKSMFSGLYLLVRYPYVMGIFGMIFFWEIVNVIFNYIRLGMGQAATKTMAGFGAFLFQQVCFVHVMGLIFVVFGTGAIISKLGERRSLIMIPISIGCVIGYYLMAQTLLAASVAYIAMRAINYAFAYPLRESLYIPTTKDTKFKSKSWIDGFGSKLSKGIGNSYNLLIQGLSSASMLHVHLVFFGLVIALWSIMAHFLGKRFETAVKNNEVIGT